MSKPKGWALVGWHLAAFFAVLGLCCLIGVPEIAALVFLPFEFAWQLIDIWWEELSSLGKPR